MKAKKLLERSTGPKTDPCRTLDEFERRNFEKSLKCAYQRGRIEFNEQSKEGQPKLMSEKGWDS